MKFIISLYIFLIIFFITECYDRQPWTLERKSGEIKIDEIVLTVRQKGG